MRREGAGASSGCLRAHRIMTERMRGARQAHRAGSGRDREQQGWQRLTATRRTVHHCMSA